MAKRKGQNFELDLAKGLSLWMSQGKNDFLFHRSASSGAMCTQRAKKGKKTVEHSGDLAAVHPFGHQLTAILALEAKRGYNASSPLDLIDTPDNNKTNVYKDFIEQCIREMEEGGKIGFWLIHKRDRRKATICMPYTFYLKYREIFGDFLDKYIRVRYNADLELFICELDKFLEYFKPEFVFGAYKDD